MQVTEFKSLKPTTIVLIVNLKEYLITDTTFDGAINLDWAFSLLPITRIKLPEQKRVKQNIKLPHVDIPGAILSLRHKGHTRGIIRSTNKKCFKNSVTIDISVKSKNLNIKLSAFKFHVCGANSVDQALEGINYIINYLHDIQDEIDYINQNYDMALSTIQTLKKITKGSEIKRELNDSTSMSCDENTQTNEILDYTIDKIDDFEKYRSEEFDVRIANFLYRQAEDFKYHSHFSTEIDYILTIKKIINHRLEIDNYWKAMVNINYDLKFDIDRDELRDQLNGCDGFYARYNNMFEHSVTVYLPYEPKNNRQVRKKNKQTCHTYIVYQSGLVTQSGPGDELMEEAYYKFIEVINRIKDKIMIKNCVKKLKYIPFSDNVSTSIEETETD
jgi:hypothetical protein